MKNLRFSSLSTCVLALLFCTFSTSAIVISNQTVTVDFDEYYAGTLLGYSDPSSNTHLQRYTSSANNDLSAGQGFELTVQSDGGADVAALYDTDRRIYEKSNGGATLHYHQVTSVRDNSEGDAAAGEDSDLEIDDGTDGEWEGGNLQNTRLGNALIIQENFDSDDISQGHLDLVQGQDSNSNKRAPDDSGAGGYISFGFESSIYSFGFSWIDLDERINGVYGTTITFVDTSGTVDQSVTVDFVEFESGVFQSRNGVDQNVVWGDGHANNISSISVAELNNVMNTNLNSFDEVRFDLKGSGGIGHVTYSFSAVPEPSTYAFGAGMILLIGVHFWRNRKKAKTEA